MEYRGLKSAKVQIGAELLCKSGKVNARNRGQDYRVQITECRGGWLARVWSIGGR
jgi:hypothetical protein